MYALKKYVGTIVEQVKYKYPAVASRNQKGTRDNDGMKKRRGGGAGL